MCGPAQTFTTTTGPRIESYVTWHNTHGTVNHSTEFVSEEGVPTNSLEGAWGNIKQIIATMHGIHRHHLQVNIDYN